MSVLVLDLLLFSIDSDRLAIFISRWRHQHSTVQDSEFVRLSYYVLARERKGKIQNSIGFMVHGSLDQLELELFTLGEQGRIGFDFLDDDLS